MDDNKHQPDKHQSDAEAPTARILRYSLALVMLWFGALKLRPSGSTVEALAGDTIHQLTAGRVAPTHAVVALGAVESALGLALLSGRALRPTLAVMGLHLIGASSPLVVFPRRSFRRPWEPTLEGHYIVKNAVLAAAGLELASRAGRRRRD